MLSLDKQAKTGTQRPQDEDTVVEIKNSTEMQGYKSSPLDQAGAFADQHQTVSHKMEADAGRNLLHGEQQNHENVHNGVEDNRLSTATPQYEPSPSDDVSLNLGGGVQDDDADLGLRRHDEPGGDERRVVFLAPPRVSPVFIPPRSSYPVGPPPIGSAYGTPPIGQIGVHYPREMIRIERDYSGGDLVQFYPVYPIELEGRITQTQWLDTVNGINEILMSAHSLRRAALDHVFSVLTLYISSLIFNSHYDKEMSRLRTFIDQCNQQLYHSQGLNILWPRPAGFLFMEIEYY